MSTLIEKTEKTEKEYRYTAVCEKLYSDELGEYESYGIEIRKNGELVCRVSDISTDKDELERLAELCEREELSPIHIYDVIEDFLGM